MNPPVLFSQFGELRGLYRVLLVLLMGCSWSVEPCDAQANVLAHQVKAAMLYKFLAYVEWPPGAFPAPTSPYVIAVAGATDVADELRHLTLNRSINERVVVVRDINPQDDLAGIHMLFVGRDAAHSQKSLFRRAARQAIVTVTENDAGLMRGGIINFRTVDDRIGFDVSLVTALRRNLKLSARLLAVATFVETGER